MENDFIKELAFKGFTARVKRLSDQLLYDARKLYETIEIGIEPNWHLVFMLLKQEKELTVTEIAQQLGFSHPAIIKIVKKMKEHGYVESKIDSEDNRRFFIKLSEKALVHLPILEKKWETIQEVVQELIDESFLQKLTEVENKLNEENLYQRCLKKFQDND